MIAFVTNNLFNTCLLCIIKTRLNCYNIFFIHSSETTVAPVTSATSTVSSVDPSSITRTASTYFHAFMTTEPIAKPSL